MIKKTGSTFISIMIVLVTAVIIITGYFVYAYNYAMNAATEPDDVFSLIEKNLQEEYNNGYPSLEKYHNCHPEFRRELDHHINTEYAFYKIIDNTIYIEYDISKKDFSEEHIFNNEEAIKENVESFSKEVSDYANEQSNIEEISYKYEFYNEDKLLLSFENTYTYPKRPEN